jgi:hypothetical protein
MPSVSADITALTRSDLDRLLRLAERAYRGDLDLAGHRDLTQLINQLRSDESRFRRRAVISATKSGCPRPEVAFQLGVGPTRVSQLVHGRRK